LPFLPPRWEWLPVKLILSRKGFDSASGGCPSPILPDGAMLALPIPDARSPLRYRDLLWNGRDVGEMVERLTKGRIRADSGAHLDLTSRRDLVRRRARVETSAWPVCRGPGTPQ
jgi:hypothetical protein